MARLTKLKICFIVLLCEIKYSELNDDLNTIAKQINYGNELFQLYERVTLIVGDESSNKKNVFDLITKGINETVTLDHNFFPQLKYNSSSKTAIYECLNFTNKNNVTVELINQYFMKKVIETATEIKLVVVINEKALNYGVQKNSMSFLNVVHHLTNFVKRLEDKERGYVLIVTANSSVDSMEIKQRTIKYLRQIKLKLQKLIVEGEILSSELVMTYQQVIIFIDVVLRQSEDGFFRKFAVYSENSTTKDAYLVKFIINEYTGFVGVNKNDFHFNDNSKTFVEKLLGSTMQIVDKTVAIAYEHAKLYFMKALQETFDLDYLQMNIQANIEIFSDVCQSIEVKRDPVLFVDSVLRAITIVGLTSIPKITVASLSKCLHELKVIAIVRNITLIGNYESTENLTRRHVNVLSNLHLWIEFLFEVYTLYSKYKIQDNRELYDQKNLEAVYTEYMSLENLPVFLNKFKHLTGAYYEKHLKMDIDWKQMFLLNFILLKTLRSKLDVQCNEESLIVKGKFVKLSTVKNLLETDCQRVNEATVYAFDTILIDCDFVRVSENFILSILAVKWSVQGRRKINLFGWPATEFKLAAKNGRYAFRATNGTHGRRGYPGTTAGSFFGLGQQFFRDELLTIEIRGANGGMGQKGGDGGDADNGDAKSAMFTYISENQGSDCPSNRFSYKDYNFYIDKKYETYTTYWAFAQGKPGNGGNGGAGGLGGYAGLNLIKVGENSKVTQIVENGSDGEDGSYGFGGSAGDTYKYGFACKKNTFKADFSYYHVFEKDGSPGKPGISLDNTYYPQPLKEPDYINIYQSFRFQLMMTNLDDVFIVNDTMDLLLKVDNEEFIVSKYTTSYFIVESNNLYHLLTKVKNKNAVIELFFNLVRGIGKFYSVIEDVDEKQTLASLYTQIISKLVRFYSKQYVEHYIFDLENYVDDILRTFREEDALPKRIVRFERINKEYRQSVRDITTSTQKFIDDMIVKTLNSKTIMNLNEVEFAYTRGNSLLREFYQKANEKLFKIKREEEMNLIFSSIIETYKTVTRVSQAFYLTANAIQNACEVLPDILHFDTDRKVPLKEVQNAIASLNDIHNFIVSEDQMIFNKTFEEFLAQSKKLPSAEALRELVTNFMRRIKAEADTIKIRSLQYQLRNEIKSQYLEVESLRLITQMKPVYYTVLKNCYKSILHAELSKEIYYVYRSNDSISDYIEMVYNRIDFRLKMVLQKYKLEIENILIVLIKKSWAYLEVLRKEITQKKAVLTKIEISVWQVEQVFKEVMYLLEQAFKLLDPKFQDKAIQPFYDISYVSMLLTQLYSKLEYETLETHLLNCLKLATSLPTNNLTTFLQFNAFYWHYNNVVKHVAQYMFPFTDIHMYDFQESLLDRKDVPAEDLETYTNMFVHSIENLPSILENFRSNHFARKQQDVEFKTFSRDHKYSTSFYTWDSERDTDFIYRLLRGREVTVFFDVSKSNLEIFAVKFKTIRLKIRSVNATLDEHLQRKIRYFDLTLVHMGNNHYQCNGKVYLIPTQNQTLYYSYSRLPNSDEPNRYNVIMDKVKEGVLQMSPYATWKFKLQDIDHGWTFASLREDFVQNLDQTRKSQIQMNLEGDFFYVTNVDICDNVEKYYYRNEIKFFHSDDAEKKLKYYFYDRV